MLVQDPAKFSVAPALGVLLAGKSKALNVGLSYEAKNHAELARKKISVAIYSDYEKDWSEADLKALIKAEPQNVTKFEFKIEIATKTAELFEIAETEERETQVGDALTIPDAMISGTADENNPSSKITNSGLETDKTEVVLVEENQVNEKIEPPVFISRDAIDEEILSRDRSTPIVPLSAVTTDSNTPAITKVEDNPVEIVPVVSQAIASETAPEQIQLEQPSRPSLSHPDAPSRELQELLQQVSQAQLHQTQQAPEPTTILAPETHSVADLSNPIPQPSQTKPQVDPASKPSQPSQKDPRPSTNSRPTSYVPRQTPPLQQQQPQTPASTASPNKQPKAPLSTSTIAALKDQRISALETDVQQLKTLLSAVQQTVDEQRHTRHDRRSVSTHRQSTVDRRATVFAAVSVLLVVGGWTVGCVLARLS